MPAPSATDRTSLLDALEQGEVHVWTVAPASIGDPGLLRRYAALLAPDERARQQRFAFERDRHRFLVTRALVRTTLSRYLATDPSRWTFRTNAYGRPEIAAPSPVPLVFSVAHTSDLVGCAVGLERPLGLDVEDTRRPIEALSIAERFFAPSEAAELQRHQPSQQRERFFEYWTLKEAYVKARGMGLSIPLQSFWFEIAADATIRVGFASGLDDEPRDWQFQWLRPTAHHVVAVAIRRHDEPDLRILSRSCVPLAD